MMRPDLVAKGRRQLVGLKTKDPKTVLEEGTLQGVVSFHDVAKAVYEEQSFENRMLKSYIEDSPTAR